MIYKDEQLKALLPANIRDDGMIVSHEGVTYGGFVYSAGLKLKMILQIFLSALNYLNSKGITLLRYKAIPIFYDKKPSEEINYALFLLNARLYRRDTSITIDLHSAASFSNRRKYEIKKAKRAGVFVAEEKNFGPFWTEILIPNLQQRYGRNPVHSLEEITLLASRFPSNIRQYCAYTNDRISAGVIIYETETVAHTQYIGVNAIGRNSGALDYLIAHLITNIYLNKKYFDFGICNENEGRYLNTGLLEWKEGFRGRCFCHDFYEIDTSKSENLIPIING